MGSSPEKPIPPSEEGDDAALLQHLEAELMGHPSTEDGLAAARREMQERDFQLRKQELHTALVEHGEFVAQGPRDFPDRETLLALFDAAIKLVDPLGYHRPHQLHMVLQDIRPVVRRLEEELQKSGQAQP